MSAESPRRTPRKGSAGHVVLPQPVSDPSIIDSVAGFIHDVVPQAYTGGSSSDNRDVIIWAKFEQADINDPAFFPDTGEEDGVPPLLLVLGYGNGVQVWCVPATGEAREVLSWSQGSVRTLRLLPTPEPRLPLRQDLFKHKRPLVALVDNTGPGPQFCSVSFISLRDVDQVKSIKFKNQVWDVLANRRSVVVTLAEKIAVFDALTLEDHIAVTTCYPSPDINPVALGTRWLAYADRRMVSHWRSLGGCQTEGPQSVTATMMHAAKFLGKGLRDLSETVASSLTGGSPEANFPVPPEPCLKGIVTVIDIESKASKEPTEGDSQVGSSQVLAHFNAHCEPIVALSFDPSGMLLLTADKRGHRFHVFRINTHPCGPTFAFIQHLYILHRGDTTARIQDVAFSCDSRWVAVSSMRGTTHVFPITPYGGAVGVRTHTTPHVVNKLSRFHRSAGLTEDGRNSPVPHEGPPLTPPLSHRNPTAVQPTTVTALAQIRRQLAVPTSPHLPEDATLRVAACFGSPRANIPPVVTGTKDTRRAVDSLFIMACSGNLIQYDLEPRHASGISKEKVCDDTAVELLVEARAEWVLLRPPYLSSSHPPLSHSNPLLAQPDSSRVPKHSNHIDDERWLSQVEIVTHAGPHRRLWMGPQFTFKTYNPASGCDGAGGETVDIDKQPAPRSNPVNMPLRQPLIIESGSSSSFELSPSMVELIYKNEPNPTPDNNLRIREDLAEAMQEKGESRLREDLADAMMESPRSLNRTSGVRGAEGGGMRAPIVERQVNPLGTVVTITTAYGSAHAQHPPDIIETSKDQPKLQVVVTQKKTSTSIASSSSTLILSSDDINVCMKKKYDILESKKSSFHKSENNKNKDIKEVDFKNSRKSKCIDTSLNETMETTKTEEANSGITVVESCDKKVKNGKSKRKVSKGSLKKNENDDKEKYELDISCKTNEKSCSSKTDTVLDLHNIPEVMGTKRSGKAITHISGEDKSDKIVPKNYECEAFGNDVSYSIAVKSDNTLQSSASVMNCKDCNSYNLLDRGTNKNSDVLSSQNSCDGLEKVYSSEKLANKFKSNDVLNTQFKLNSSPPVTDTHIDKTEECVLKSNTLEFNDVHERKIKIVEEVVNISPKTKKKKLKNTEVTRHVECYNENKAFDEIVSVNYRSEKSTSQLDNKTSDRSDEISEDCLTEDSKSLIKDNSVTEKCETVKDLEEVTESSLSKKDNAQNDETTDKDSSDDSQKNSELKVNLKKGKGKKSLRKCESENKSKDNNIIRNSQQSSSLETEEEAEKSDITQTEAKGDAYGVSVEDHSKLSNNDKKINQSECNESGINNIISDKCSQTKIKKDEKESDKNNLSNTDKLVSCNSDLVVTEKVMQRKSWKSVISDSDGMSEDPNGNFPKLDDATHQVRSWSSVAAGPSKTRTSHDKDTVKNNSVDSVYESCNDSVGEELEPATDSLGSNYELCCKDEGIQETEIYQSNEDESKNLSNDSLEESPDKSNTDSGEKEDITAVTALSKKTKKPKKKRRFSQRICEDFVGFWLLLILLLEVSHTRSSPEDALSVRGKMCAREYYTGLNVVLCTTQQQPKTEEVFICIHTCCQGLENFDELSLSSYESASHCSPSPSITTENGIVFPNDGL